MIAYIFGLHVHANVLNVAAGLSKPPYIIEETNSGFELDLVRAVFENMGHTIKFIYVPYGRSQSLLTSGKVDAALGMDDSLELDPLNLSEPYLIHQNVAVSLKSNQLDIQSISDFSKYSIASFQNSTKVLGPEYAKAVQKSRMYFELPEQRRQVEMFMIGNVKVAVLDINIFYYLSQEINNGISLYDEVNVHRLFPINKYRVGFKSKEVKTNFNKALAKYLHSIQYVELQQKYKFHQLNRLPSSLIMDVGTNPSQH